MPLRKSLLIVALGILILTSTTATAGNNEKSVVPIESINFIDSNNEKSVVPIESINFIDRVVYVLDHTSNPTQGNWL